MDNESSVVEYFAEHERYKCGYCGSADTNYSHGMWAHSMTVQDYEDLLNRGWRRSGKYTYKPTMEQTCCPQYTIRCEVLNYKLRKSHKKVLKTVNKYLIHGIKSDDKDETDTKADVKTKQEDSNPAPTAGVSTVSQSSGDKLAASHHSRPPPIPGAGADPSKPKCKKAKQLRMERKLAKAAGRDGVPVTPTDKGQQKTSGSKSNEKTLEDYLSEPDKAQNCAHKLEMRLVRTYPKSKEFEESLKESHDVYHRYQMVIHKDPPHKPNMKQYTRFLVDSSLQPPVESEGGLPLGYGSFHQQYILDGKIICVGVIDILPTLVSSKYLYYDPDYHFLSLGTYSALREIQFVRELNKYSSKMIYYYMGFYLHNCPKMKYKGQYYPSFLLCPETNTWHPIEKCSPLLDKNTYSRFADKETEDEEAKVDINDTLVLHARQAMRYEIYNAIKSALKPGRSDAEEVKEYAGLVGKTCASRMLLFRK